MYTPEIYKNENQGEIKKFLQENSFGILINQTNGKLCATYIPFGIDAINKDGKDILYGHISKERKPAVEWFYRQRPSFSCIFQDHILISPHHGTTMK